MFDLAHVTDLHLLERNHRERSGLPWQRLHYLSAGRPLDAEARRARALAALQTAGRKAAHVVLTGDLTEDGVPAQFELLAEVLAESGIDPRRLTLVPGNHDVCSDFDAFQRALRGPLRAYAATSGPAGIVPIGQGAWLLPVCTAIPQSVVRSCGRLADDDVVRIRELAHDARRARKLPLVAQHHPPHGFGGAAWNWIDGLLNADVGRSLLDTHSRLHVLHGHTHKHESATFAPGRAPQAHSGAAAVASADNVRFYRMSREALLPVDAHGRGDDACSLRLRGSSTSQNSKISAAI